MTDKQSQTRIFEPDTSLIRQWSVAVAKAAPYPAPYVAAFGRDNAQLRYIAAKHHGDIASPTLKTVKQLFDDFKPQVVIVEGVPNEGVVSPSWYLQYARLHEKTGFRHGGGETAYAAKLAGDLGIDFVPAEPTDKVKLEGLLAKGYTAADFLCWNTCQLLHGNNIGEKDAPHRLTSNLQNVARSAGLEPATISFDMFKVWYAEKMGQDFNPLAAAKDNMSPSKKGNFLQQLTQAVDDVREPHIVRTVAERMEKFDRVLVVYGSSHLAKQSPVLEKMLGKPEYMKPF